MTANTLIEGDKSSLKTSRPNILVNKLGMIPVTPKAPYHTKGS